MQRSTSWNDIKWFSNAKCWQLANTELRMLDYVCVNPYHNFSQSVTFKSSLGVLYNSVMQLTISCPTNYSAFPFDEHICKVIFYTVYLYTLYTMYYILYCYIILYYSILYYTIYVNVRDTGAKNAFNARVIRFSCKCYHLNINNQADTQRLILTFTQ